MIAQLFTFIFFSITLVADVDAQRVAVGTGVVPRRALTAQNRKKGEECPPMFASYLASIRDSAGNHNCGGVVISENTILTSASCVDRRFKPHMAEHPLIHIGGFDSNEPVQVRIAETTVIHPRWNGNQFEGRDLAIIELDRPTCVRPVKHIGRPIGGRETFVVLGYGRMASRGTFSASILRGSNVTVIDRKDCNANFPVYGVIGPSETCVQTTTGVAGVCAGDEGGPILYAPVSRVDKDNLIGIVSYTVGICDDQRSVAVATNVRRFRKWIRKTRTTFLLIPLPPIPFF